MEPSLPAVTLPQEKTLAGRPEPPTAKLEMVKSPSVVLLTITELPLRVAVAPTAE